MIGLLVQIFLLLLVSLAAELSPLLEIEHSNLINLVSIITAAICILVHALRWSAPMYNEVPLIVVSIWFLLSTQTSLYCICCNPHPHTHSHSLIVNSNLAKMDEWDFPEEDGGDFHCKEEHFRYFYALVGMGLFLASFFNDMRNYYLSALNRAITLSAFFILLLLLIISPLSSTQFNVNQTLLIIARTTVYHILWFTSHYKTTTDQILIQHYKETIKKAKHSSLLYKDRERGKMDHSEGDAPINILKRIDQMTETIRKHRSTSGSVIGAGNDPVTERKALFNRYVEKMSEINHICYAGAWLTSWFSWKNRHASLSTQRLFDIIQILWILAVPAYWLLVLCPLTFLWLLCQIYANTNELPHTLKTTRILEVVSPS